MKVIFKTEYCKKVVNAKWWFSTRVVLVFENLRINNLSIDNKINCQDSIQIYKPIID